MNGLQGIIDTTLGQALLSQARATIAARLGVPCAAPQEHAALDAPGATFVTLTRHGNLRGCMGQLAPSRSLRRDVTENALAAAFRDPRFAPLAVEEWGALRIEVSVLGPTQFHDCPSEEDASRLVTPGLDGVILASGCHRATFLPQVWEQLPALSEFLARLREKAGLRGAWPRDMQLGLYRVDKYREDE